MIVCMAQQCILCLSRVFIDCGWLLMLTMLCDPLMLRLNQLLNRLVLSLINRVFCNYCAVFVCWIVFVYNLHVRICNDTHKWLIYSAAHLIARTCCRPSDWSFCTFYSVAWKLYLYLFLLSFTLQNACILIVHCSYLL